MDDGMKCFLERNPILIKMNIPGCTRLTVEGILKFLKNFTSRNILPGGIKKVIVSERYNVQQLHFEELIFLIGEDRCIYESNVKKTRYYGHKYSMFCSDDDCTIDIDLCPRCRFFQMVYDCPAKSY
ncbi:hypothetical protein MKX03_007668 [Papaver bracteatum]|nr:hypothetical protein MKX03_007668 [Papaver bracteatum]